MGGCEGEVAGEGVRRGEGVRVRELGGVEWLDRIERFCSDDRCVPILLCCFMVNVY